MVYLNLQEGYEEEFENYNVNNKSDYKRVIDINDTSIIVVNDRLIVDGQCDCCGFLFPITILQDLNFNISTQEKEIGVYQADIIPGDYEGELFLSFPEYTGKGYYGVLSSVSIPKVDITQLDSTEKYRATIHQYLIDNKIENTPFKIDIAFEGDFAGNGEKGLVIEINDTYRDDSYPIPYKEKWTQQKFEKDKTSFVNAILIIDDINKPLEYREVKSNIWTHLDEVEYMTENIAFIDNLDNDTELELIISNVYYEYLDYSIVDLN